MYKLYWAPNTGAFAPQVMLEEIGLDYERVPISMAAGEHRQPDYLALNPMGQIPVLILPDGAVMSESAAIVIHLAESHPEFGLIPPIGDPRRPTVLRWLLFLACDLYETDLRYYYPDRYTEDAAPDGVKAAAAARLNRLWAMLEAALDPGPYLLGADYSVVDAYILMQANWHPDPDRLFADCPRVRQLCDLVRARPAVARIWDQHFPEAA